MRRHAWWLVVGSFAVATLLIGLFSLYSMRTAAERADAEKWHSHTLEVLAETGTFRVATFDLLRGERGYLLTADASFLQPYHRGRRDSARLLEHLRGMVSDHDRQQRNLAEVRARLKDFMSVIDRTVALEQQGAHEEAVAIVRAGHGRREFLRLQASIDQVEAVERGLLTSRRLRLAETALWHDRLGHLAAAIRIIVLGIAALAALTALKAQRVATAAAEELGRLASVDELTGLPNRRHFLARLEAEMARARRTGSALCLATLDIDHFKRVNDMHGHLAGDEVLRQMATNIREKIRLDDSPARLGGEEFALLLPNSNAHQAHLVCDRLRAAIAARPIVLPDGGTLRVTLSTGVAMLRAADDSEELMRRSDEALYEAKARGRNQVRLAA